MRSLARDDENINLLRLGIHCTKCRFRMLPSLTPFKGDKFFYCMPCGFGVGSRTGIIVTLLSLVKREEIAA